MSADTTGIEQFIAHTKQELRSNVNVDAAFESISSDIKRSIEEVATLSLIHI